MDWLTCLSSHRIGERQAAGREQIGNRSEFHKDYDRIIFSSAFRRLSDKTQVVPLTESDYTRQRLTHSLEVSCVGRSLATMVYQTLPLEVKQHVSQGDFEAIVAAASLAHDIGNPPFGHFGERAIQDWMVNQHKAGRWPQLTDQQWLDFQFFEGNAQSFRVLTRLQMGGRRGGMRLTAATLGALMKYPSGSSKSIDRRYRKHGYFVQDADMFQELVDTTGQKQLSEGEYQRHPLAYLSEAADDICYGIIDVEDGCRAGLIKEDTAVEAFEGISSGCTGNARMPIEDRMAMARALIINKLTTEAAAVFQENRQQIIEGSSIPGLIEQTTCATSYRVAKNVAISEYFRSEPVLTMEVAGYRAIQGLLEVLSAAVVDQRQGAVMEHVKCLTGLQTSVEQTNVYDRLLLVTDYVSGLTDRHTLQHYERLKDLTNSGMIPH